MCGIVGYIGPKQAVPILLDGLSHLSYRGYDSAGVAVMEDGRIAVRKSQGKLDRLEALLENHPVSGTLGIGHTRWATHGEPSDVNAHPHTDLQGGIAVVHNGIIENHEALRRHLESTGARFASQTDTEVIAHLLYSLYNGNMRQTIMQAMSMMQGSYAIGIICSQEPDTLYCARNDSPLVAGFRDGAGYIASDIPALLGYTRDVIFLQDKEIGVLTRNGVSVYDAYGKSCFKQPFHVTWDVSSAEKGGYAHYMLKEIHEQPNALQSTFTPRSHQRDWLPLSAREAQSLSKITLVACGTAYHAAVLGKYVVEKLARVPVDAEIASEYRYREPIIVPGQMTIAISQSGETADTLAALRLAKQNGSRTMAICNVVGSSLVREAEHTLYTYAGPEIAVASTKAFLTQAEMLLMLAVSLARLRKSAPEAELDRLWEQLRLLPQKAQAALETERDVQRTASRLRSKKHAFFVGRGMDYALSMEGALKLKEVSYVFSEAYAAGELKHGPIALLQDGRLVVASVTQSALLEKTMSNLREAKTRGAYLVAVCTQSLLGRVSALADETIVIPDTDDLLAPLLAAIPLQLFAYCMAVGRGCDVDQPRNLAKSVTVE